MSELAEGENESEAVIDRLLAEARSGSNSQLGELLQSYRDYLLLVADEELGADLKAKAAPSDLVQESFLEAKRDFPKFTGQSSAELQAWLRRILLNNVANVVRGYRGTDKRDVSRELSESELSGSGIAGRDPTASSLLMKHELLSEVREAVGRLPGHYQDVINWRNYERLSFEEIGDRMGRSAEAVRKLWVRALELLQQELDSANGSSTQRSRDAAR